MRLFNYGNWWLATGSFFSLAYNYLMKNRQSQFAGCIFKTHTNLRSFTLIETGQLSWFFVQQKQTFFGSSAE